MFATMTDMLDEGSPKTSHRDIMIVAVIAAAVMLIASFGAHIEYRAVGRDIQLDIGGAWATIVSVGIILLMLAWYRGYIASSWPVWGSLALAAGVLIFIGGDWLTALTAERHGGVSASMQLHVTTFATAVVVAACVAGLRRPVVEESEALGQWRSQARDESREESRRER